MNEEEARRRAQAAGLRLTVMLKRIVPFMVSLIFGVLLVNLVFSGNFQADEVSNSPCAQSSSHSKTWLFISGVPAPNYTQKEAREKGALYSQRLRVLLDADGTVSAITPVSSDSFSLIDGSVLSEGGREFTREFTRDTIEAARHIRFRPATEDGRPISLWVTVDYSCSGEWFAHRYVFYCRAQIVEVERDWRTIYE